MNTTLKKPGDFKEWKEGSTLAQVSAEHRLERETRLREGQLPLVLLIALLLWN